MRISQQIGWSQESKLIYNIIKQLEKLEVVWDHCCTTTTTSSTTAGPCLTYYSIIPITPTTAFDIPNFNFTPTQDADYTIEWFMKMTDDVNFPRIFSIGAYPSAQHSVSIESDTLYYWINGSIAASVPLTSYLGQWVWVVISRTFDGIGIYINGIRVSIIYNSAAIPANGNPLVIGCEMVAPYVAPVSGTSYNGLLSNFRWTVGLAVYGNGSDITSQYPTAPLTLLPETVILVFQGNSLIQELIPLYQPTAEYGFNYTGPCFEYSADNPFEGYQGSLIFKRL